MLTKFSGWQYLLIDAANNFGLDKFLFEQRIQWAEDNLNQLEFLISQADNKPLYHKAVMAIRSAQAKVPTGHLVGFDACCSGIQIMSAVTGCLAGATATGLIDPNVRADAYNSVTEAMREELGSLFHVERKDAKAALMTSFYGSKKTPKNIFGEDTPELNAFYQAAAKTAPGAWELLQDLLAAWQPYTLAHAWKMPDGFDVRVKVMEKKEARIEVDELDHASFTYEFYENVGTETGLSLVANVTHSLDAYLLRCLERRCNYREDIVRVAMHLMETELEARHHGAEAIDTNPEDKIAYYLEQYRRSTVPDVVILSHISAENVAMLSTVHLELLTMIVNQMLQYNPFPILTVH